MSEPKPNQIGFQTDDIAFNSIYKQLEQLSKKDTSRNNPEYWLELRSKIYIRDKGVCWICNGFVELPNYDLGHLVDKCMGGWDDYDNLAVMHTLCNLSKPHHTTLEDAIRWRLTPHKYLIDYTSKENPILAINKSELYIPPKPEMPQINVVPHVPYHRKNKPNELISLPRKSFWGYLVDYFHKGNSEQKITNKQIPQDETMDNKQKAKYDAQCAKIKPCTICWVQGYPQGGAMWRILPPPYQKEDGFIMRRTPIGAREPKGEKGVANSMQVINGELKEVVTVDLGIMKFTITPNKNKQLIVTFITTDKANSSKYGKTIGSGQNQIPYEEWDKAKIKGMTLDEFRRNYASTDKNSNNKTDYQI